MESLGEKLLEKGREYLVDELAKRVTKDPNELVTPTACANRILAATPMLKAQQLTPFVSPY